MKTRERSCARLLAAALATLALTAAPASAGTVSANPTAPAVNGFDIANYATVTGTEKWWTDNNTSSGSAKGQTFATGIAAVRLNSISYQVASSQKAEPEKTYVVRVGTVSGTTFTEVHSETFTQDFTWNAGEFMTWTFTTPPVLTGDTTYAVDIGLASSTSAWQTGIPYLNKTANDFTGGQRYTSGQSGAGDDEMHFDVSGDMIFHLDLEKPIGPVFEFVGGNPADDDTAALIRPQLVATFSRDIVAGTGNVRIMNLTDSTEETLPISDTRVSLSDNLLLIETPGLVAWNKTYAVRIDTGAIESVSGDSFPGIIDDTTWNFSTLPSDPLLTAIAELMDHINGVITLNDAEIETHKLTIDLHKWRFDESVTTITAVLDLVETYDNEIGPLWVARGQFDRDYQDNDLDWTIYHVMQYIIDGVYHAATFADPAKLELLEDYDDDGGYKFGSSANFPGPAAPPDDPDNTHTATINGNFPDSFGRNTQGWTVPARKPTGCYLAPGTVATVTVPASLVGQGYKVRIGAHSWDLSHRRWVKRLDRSTILYPLDAATIKVASPLGGGIYIEVPFGADAGVVNIDITGAIRAPYFSAKSFHATTPAEWETERDHPAPWADFQSDKFMAQVPTNWVYAHPDPAQLMTDWDAAMDAINDLMGFPHDRGKETMYLQVDLIMRSSVHAPGYPAINTTDNPNTDRGGYHDNYIVRGPGASPTASHIEFHEQGHAYGFPKFGGESESNVNLLQPAMLHRKFGYNIDVAQRASLGSGNVNRTLDNTAVAWMCVFNFSPREVPMASGEKAYQHKGHAKFLDIARLFGWQGLDGYWRSFMEDDANGIPYGSGTDDLLLRLSRNLGCDIRPLFHFWGIHPSSPATLQASIDAEELRPSAEIYSRLQHYKTLVPADNAAFQTFALAWWGRQPSINGYWEEREHARQWDSTELFGDGDQQRPDGEIYVEASAADIRNRVEELIDLYFTDYTAWSAGYPSVDLGDPDADSDGDGLTNNEERIWGQDPTAPSSASPFTTPIDTADGSFSYTRRDDGLTGNNYSIWTSTDLATWTSDSTAVQTSGTPDANDVETVAVTLSPDLLTEPRLFVRVQAAE